MVRVFLFVAVLWLAWDFRIGLAVAHVQYQIDRRIIDVRAIQALPTTWPEHPDVLRLRILAASITGAEGVGSMIDRLEEIDPGSPAVRKKG